MGFMNRGFFTGLAILVTTGVLVGALLPNMLWSAGPFAGDLSPADCY